MKNAHYTRYHGLGNDYLVINPKNIPFSINAENARLICDRNFGIGSDGILLGPIMQNQDIHLRIINPDGSEAEKSGNGVRIFARYLHENQIVQNDQFSFYTKGGKVSAEIIDTEDYAIKVNMGRYEIIPEKIPVDAKAYELPIDAIINETLVIENEEFSIATVSMGNPHCVVFHENASESFAKKWGPVFEKHALFPNRTNVQFVKTPITNKKKIEIYIWERGAGYTLASGSSSCAASVASFLRQYIQNDITVKMPGGNLNININPESSEVWMTGPVFSISNGFFSNEMIDLISAMEN